MFDEFLCLTKNVFVAAGLTSKSIFKITFDRDLSEYSRRLEWSNGSGSDLFAILNAYKIWMLKHNQKVFGKSKEQQKAERDFCSRHYLDVRSLNECHQLVQELTKRLDKLNIRQSYGADRVRYTEQEKSIILKLVIAGAFYPNIFATSPVNNPMIERDAFHVMNGRDPNNTVFFTGFRQENIRQLYVTFIRDLFKNTVVDPKDINCVKVSFDANSEKVFVTFDTSQDICGDNRSDWDTKHCSIPGKTLTEVYKAVKMRKMNMPTRIPLMPFDTEKMMAERYGIGVMIDSTFTFKGFVQDDIRDICIPKTNEKVLIGTISHVSVSLSKTDCRFFFFFKYKYYSLLEYADRKLFEILVSTKE